MSLDVFGILFLETDLLQNVVYQNEEGRWVTDLAYYTSFNDEQDLQMSPNDEMNEDFKSGSKYIAKHFIVPVFIVSDDVLRLPFYIGQSHQMFLEYNHSGSSLVLFIGKKA
jgi:hypothetical protein